MFRHQIDPELYLRQLTQSDAETLFAVIEANRAHLQRWLPNRYIAGTLRDVELELCCADDLYEMKGYIDAGVWLGAALVGMVTLHPYWPRRESTIGYWLARSYQGRGLMTRAVQAIVTHAFNDYHLGRLEIHCAVDNWRSRAVAERLGFRLERIKPNGQRLNGQTVDEAIYGLFDWKWRGEPHPLELKAPQAGGLGG